MFAKQVIKAGLRFGSLRTLRTTSAAMSGGYDGWNEEDTKQTTRVAADTFDKVQHLFLFPSSSLLFFVYINIKTSLASSRRDKRIKHIFETKSLLCIWELSLDLSHLGALQPRSRPSEKKATQSRDARSAASGKSTITNDLNYTNTRTIPTIYSTHAPPGFWRAPLCGTNP